MADLGNLESLTLPLLKRVMKETPENLGCHMLRPHAFWMVWASFQELQVCPAKEMIHGWFSSFLRHTIPKHAQAF